MTSRVRITFGIAVLMAVFAMALREIPWLAVLATLFAVFLIIWGRLPSETEKWIAQLPAGEGILKLLNQLDMILVPRDRDLEAHLRMVIGIYDMRRREALRQLITTQNAFLVGSDWPVFRQDGLVVGEFAGPGPVKDEFREPTKRILKSLGS